MKNIQKKIRVLVFEPQQEAKEMCIKNDLVQFQKIVGGYIELVRITNDVVMLCNEEFLIHDYQPNRIVNGVVIHGTFLLIGDVSPEFGSLSDDQIKIFSDKWVEIK